MSRRDKDRTFLGIAHVLAQLGTCDRQQVGALIVRDGRCISWGYNGAPPGLPHCAENNHGWPESPLVPVSDEAKEVMGCRNATHAEANAISFAARQGISTDGAELFVTLSPCRSCASLIVAAGIVRVIWDQTYRDPAGSDLLDQAGVEKEVILGRLGTSPL